MIKRYEVTAHDAAVVITKEKGYIEKLIWVKPGTAGDDLEITDQNGSNGFKAAAGTQYETVVIKNIPWQFDGLKLAVLDSSTVYIYFNES